MTVRTIPPAFMPQEPDDEKKLVSVRAPAPAPAHWTFTEQLPTLLYGTQPADMFEITWEAWLEAPLAFRVDYQKHYNTWFRAQRDLDRKVFRYLDVAFERFVWVSFATHPTETDQ